jgi:hypothetical protein
MLIYIIIIRFSSISVVLHSLMLGLRSKFDTVHAVCLEGHCQVYSILVKRKGAAKMLSVGFEPTPRETDFDSVQGSHMAKTC